MRLSHADTLLRSTISTNAQILATEGHRDAQVIVPYLEGDPGVGKTMIVEQATHSLGGRVEVVRLCDYEPTELAGWNVPNADSTKMTRLPPNWLPEPSDELVVVFLDELPQGSVATMNAAAQLINERRIGPYRLPRNVQVVAAGNSPKNRAGTNRMPTHLRDRLMHVSIEVNVTDLTQYFLDVGVDSRIAAFLSFKPDQASKFDADAMACPSPRSWERVSTIIGMGVPEELQRAAVTGMVGAAAATEFFAFCKIIEAIPSLDDLIENPDKAPIPTRKEVLYSVVAALVSRVDEDNVSNIFRYIVRIPEKEFAAFFVSPLFRRIKRDKAAQTNMPKQYEAVRDWMLKHGRTVILGDNM